jgi:hypothetical protein
MTHVFTLDEAQDLMPRVKAITKPVFELASSFSQELQALEEHQEHTRAEELHRRLQTLLTAWADTIRALGPDVKGLWLVDFDAGDGYWCWSYPEEDLGHWHSYDGGFGTRVGVENRPSRNKE